jgi:hypothetical protein
MGAGVMRGTGKADVLAGPAGQRGPLPNEEHTLVDFDTPLTLCVKAGDTW